MKAVDFDYVRPASIEEACRYLDEAAGDGKVLAGGQTLVPLLAMRLTRPALLVDINAIPEMRGIRAEADSIVIASGTRQAEAQRSTVVQQSMPLLIKGLHHVGHIQTRNRGTVGGSVANADPSSEICLVTQTLGGEIVASSVAGETTLAAEDYFLGPMVTALGPEDCLTAVRLPVWRDAGRLGCGFQEVSLRRSDFALASAAVQVLIDAEGICRRAAIGIGSVGSTPVRSDEAGATLVGTRLTQGDIAVAVEAAMAGLDDVESDLHASADYRRRVAGVMVERALGEAKAQALGEGKE